MTHSLPAMAALGERPGTDLTGLPDAFVTDATIPEPDRAEMSEVTHLVIAPA